MKYVLSAGVAAAMLAASAQVASAEDARAKTSRNNAQTTQVAQAPQDVPPPPSSRPWLPASPWYVSVSAAAAFPNDTTFSSGAFSGSIDFGTGFTGFAGVGYRFTPWIAAELEVGYVHLPINNISVPNASASVDGSVHGFAAFGNAVLTYPNLNYMAPYIAAGVGMVHRFDNDVTVNGTTASMGSGTDFAAQAKVGIDFRLTGSMSIAPEYRYMFINTSGNGLSNTHVHQVGASLKFRF